MISRVYLRCLFLRPWCCLQCRVGRGFYLLQPMLQNVLKAVLLLMITLKKCYVLCHFLQSWSLKLMLSVNATHILQIASEIHRNPDLFFTLFLRVYVLSKSFLQKIVALVTVILEQELEYSSFAPNKCELVVLSAECHFCLTLKKENENFTLVSTIFITYLLISPALINSKCNMSARAPQWLNLFDKLGVCMRCYRTTNVQCKVNMQGLPLMLLSIVFIPFHFE